MRWLGGASRLADRAAAAAETRAGILGVFLVALGVWWLQAVAMPLGVGRDLNTYLGAYVQLFQSNPIDLGYVFGRTPASPLFVGGILDLAGGALAEPAMSLLYAASITAWFLAARAFGGRAALLTAVVLLLYPGYGILFHEVSSDPVFAAAFAGWSLLVVRVLLAPSPARFALLGLGIAVLVLVRPGNQALIVMALLPLAVRLPWRSRLASVAAVVAPVVVVVGAWVVHNGVLWGDYTVARYGNSTVPFFRTFVTDHIVSPENGPASRELADAVQEDLLPQEPYRSYGIDLQRFFSEGSPRMQEDLIALSDRRWGWKSDSRKLRDVGVEAVRAHPWAYTRGVSTSLWQLLRQPLFRAGIPSGGGSGDGTGGGASGGSGGGGDTIVVNGRRLPKPTEGQPILAAHEGGVSTPDGSIYTVWTSPSEHHLVFVHPGDEARYDALHRRMAELRGNLPTRTGNVWLALRLNQSSRWYFPPVFWLLLGIAALAVRRPSRTLALVTPTVAGLVVMLVSALGLPAIPNYSLPVVPALVLLAAGALFGPRHEPVAATSPSAGRSPVEVRTVS